MKKIYTISERECVVGRPFSLNWFSSTPAGFQKELRLQTSKLTKKQLDELVAEGIAVEETKWDMTLEDAEKVIEKMTFGKDSAMFHGFLRQLPTYVAYILLLKGLAIIADSKYDDHISKADIEYYYGVSMINGSVVPIYKCNVKSFKTFAAFRNVQDIAAARVVLEPLAKELWG